MRQNQWMMSAIDTSNVVARPINSKRFQLLVLISKDGYAGNDLPEIVVKPVIAAILANQTTIKPT